MKSDSVIPVNVTLLPVIARSWRHRVMCSVTLLFSLWFISLSLCRSLSVYRVGTFFVMGSSVKWTDPRIRTSRAPSSDRYLQVQLFFRASTNTVLRWDWRLLSIFLKNYSLKSARSKYQILKDRRVVLVTWNQTRIHETSWRKLKYCKSDRRIKFDRHHIVIIFVSWRHKHRPDKWLASRVYENSSIFSIQNHILWDDCKWHSLYEIFH